MAINNRANYARIKSLLNEIKKSKNFELQILLGASAILNRFGELNNILKKDGFKKFKKIYSIVEGENLTPEELNEQIEKSLVKAYRNGELTEDDKTHVVNIWEQVKELA